MSNTLIARSPDLARLRAEGYNIGVRAGFLAVADIPYVASDGTVKRGTLVTQLNLVNDVAQAPQEPGHHTIHFAGDYPHHADGRLYEEIRNASNKLKIDDGLTIDHTFSAKPAKTYYDDYYHKIAIYAEILGGPARAIQPGVNPFTFPVVLADSGEDVFKYIDTASSRAEITAVSAKLKMNKVVIVGIGGTGSYVLDLVAKTPVREIHVYDGDGFLQHNAFRSPGAPSGAELEQKPFKVDYFATIYSKMRDGIVPHPVYLDASNIGEIRDADFVFLCMDSGPTKKLILNALEEYNLGFVDVGMGLSVHDNTLTGLLRVTTSTNAKRNHVWDKKRIPLSEADGQNEYERNIQVADLNALNAALAVIKWKKLFGFYADLEQEHHSTYAVDGNEITNEDCS